MRPGALRAWRTAAKLAIVVGLLGAIGVAVYAVFWQGMNGLASPACGGGGCEERLAADNAHLDALLRLAMYVGSGLVIAGSITIAATGRRLRALQRPETGPHLP